MQNKLFTSATSKASAAIAAALFISAVLFSLSLFITEHSLVIKYKIEDISDILFAAAVIIHLLWLISINLFRKSGRMSRSADFFISSTLIFFLFNYLFAANAGLEYVQRFAETSDVLNFAPDTGTERILTALLFLPLFCADVFVFITFKKGRLLSLKNMRLALTILSAAVYAFSFPSFLNLQGFGFLIFAAFIPLLIVFKISSVKRGIFYGIAFGIIQTMIINYWLATFSLVSLQFVTALYTALFTFFMMFAVYVYKKSKYGWLLFPFAWIVFEWARSSGFSAYPWCLTGSALYRYLPIIQIASVTGIWGISFFAVLINTSAAEYISRKIPIAESEGIPSDKNDIENTNIVKAEKTEQKAGSRNKIRTVFVKHSPLITTGIAAAVIIIFGLYEISKDNKLIADNTVSLALIQQNADPRKTSYEESFESLERLTNTASALSRPDLAVWSETAFVPNIRRWGALEENYNNLTRITHKFLKYQKEKGLFLLTGNDDYEIVTLDDGKVIRNEYNAAVYFSETGKRLDTYRKIKLVPFTEYFPFKKQLPWMYDLLVKMDVYLWEPGTVQTVFRHPKFKFSTPICFEDLFPDYVRKFVNNGADIIINISNDYWSLTETEGMQHFINSLFRAVENRRYVVRSTASGLTGVIDRKGKIKDTVPFYEQHFLNTVIPLNNENKTTFYTKHGDWFPFISKIVFVSSFTLILLKKRIPGL